MTRYSVVPSESKVWISARSSLHPIDSESSGLEGSIEAEVLGGGRLNLAVPPKARIEMAVERLSSGNALYDREMRRRVDVRRYPLIEGELTSMEETDRDGRYRATGEVTFHGVTRSYTDELTLTWPAPDSMCLEGEHTFDIRDFALEPPKIMMLRVYPEVTVRIRVLARREG
jgi:polyisoprenoid-binding protein YceI